MDGGAGGGRGGGGARGGGGGGVEREKEREFTSISLVFHSIYNQTHKKLKTFVVVLV